MSVVATTPVSRMTGPYPRRWSALLVLCLSLLVTVMANTSLVVAAPDMTVDLGLSSSDLQWVIDSYTVPYAALMLVLGSIGDKYSRRGALVAGLLLFAGGSVMGSLVDDTPLVIAARAAMGVGAAVVMPATLSLVVATFPRAERAKAITAWSATSGLAMGVGPLIAGWLLEDNGWRSTFLVNAPIALVAVVAALLLVPPSKAAGMGRIDYVGGALSIVSAASLVYAAIEGPHSGWNPSTVIAAAVAGLGLAVFVAWELRHPQPMLDVRKFAERPFTGSMLAVLIFFFGMFAFMYYGTQFLQFVLGYSALDTGVRLLPLAGAVFAGSALTGILTPRLGVRATVVSGLIIGTGGMLLLTRIDGGSTYGDFVAPMLALGLALGLSIAPATDTIMGSFPESELGVGGGANDTALELGGALGIAVLGSLLGTAYRDELSELLADRLPAEAMDFAQDSVGAGLGVAERVAGDPSGGQQQAAFVIDAVHQAFAPRRRSGQPHRRDRHGRGHPARPGGPAGPGRGRSRRPHCARRDGGRRDDRRAGARPGTLTAVPSTGCRG